MDRMSGLVTEYAQESKSEVDVQKTTLKAMDDEEQTEGAAVESAIGDDQAFIDKEAEGSVIDGWTMLRCITCKGMHTVAYGGDEWIWDGIIDGVGMEDVTAMTSCPACNARPAFNSWSTKYHAKKQHPMAGFPAWLLGKTKVEEVAEDIRGRTVRLGLSGQDVAYVNWETATERIKHVRGRVRSLDMERVWRGQKTQLELDYASADLL